MKLLIDHKFSNTTSAKFGQYSQSLTFFWQMPFYDVLTQCVTQTDAILYCIDSITLCHWQYPGQQCYTYKHASAVLFDQQGTQSIFKGTLKLTKSEK